MGLCLASFIVFCGALYGHFFPEKACTRREGNVWLCIEKGECYCLSEEMAGRFACFNLAELKLPYPHRKFENKTKCYLMLESALNSGIPIEEFVVDALNESKRMEQRMAQLKREYETINKSGDEHWV